MTPTEVLLAELAGSGFRSSEKHERFLPPQDAPYPTQGVVNHPTEGITVHIDPDCVRLIVDDYRDQPGYRLLLPRTGLNLKQAVAAMGYLVRLLIADRKE